MCFRLWRRSPLSHLGACAVERSDLGTRASCPHPARSAGLRSFCRALAILSALALPWLAWAETAEWSRFRGPNGGGAIEAGTLPVEVGPDRNLLWRTEIPAGDSSPVLSAERIFLTAWEGEALYTIALRS